MIDKIISYLAALGVFFLIKEIYEYIRNLIIRHKCNKIDLIICDKDSSSDIKAMVILTDKKISPESARKINEFLINEFNYRLYYNTNK